ncbi:NAD(P)-binding protein [Agrocybe pediades]|nr:NAD(P)-binding protein [Agrocybe pediades]
MSNPDSHHDQDIPPRPSRSLQGRVAIVTGAGSRANGIGNGRAAAILLAEAGANVVCLDMNLDWANVTVDMILADVGRPQGDEVPRAIALQIDVTKEDQCKYAVEHTLQRYGRLDILINNVGVGGPLGTAVDVDPAQWAKGLEINVTSMMLMTKYAVPAMEKNERHPIAGRGSIVNIASVAGLVGGTPMLLYPTSKGAVVNMTRAMAVHHAPSGIRVNCVCPGMLYTPMLYASGMSDEVREARKNRSLLKTEGNGWDTGCAVRFLASDEARWMTGSILTVDAGATAAPSGSGMGQGLSSTLAGGVQ